MRLSHYLTLSAASLTFLVSTTTAQWAGKVQAVNNQTSEGKVRADEVKQVFVEAYQDYVKYAYGKDSLLPNSLSGKNDRNGWGATIVDSLDTMLIMGLEDLYADAANFTRHIDFSRSHTRDKVSLFETTIRYLGGMLSPMELTGHRDPALISQIQTLADKLSIGWTKGSGTIPYSNLDFNTSQPDNDSTTSIATAGTLIMEWYEASKHTGDPKYFQLAEKSMKAIESLQKPLPGLPGWLMNADTAAPTSDFVSWGGGWDSWVEYLIKFAQLTGNADPSYLNQWNLAVDSSIRYLMTQSTVGNWTYLADYSQGNKIYQFSHLACFAGGNWILGGRLQNNQTIINHGLALVDTCRNTYASTASRLGPESFAFIGPNGEVNGGTLDEAGKAFYQQHGFYITDSSYILRPEVIESYVYAYRATGNKKYQDWGYEAFQALKQQCKAKAAYSSINNVNQNPAPQGDDAESFFYGETLKYLYLLFDDPGHISFDEYVFNTEAHPFKVDTKNMIPPTPSNQHPLLNTAIPTAQPQR